MRDDQTAARLIRVFLDEFAEQLGTMSDELLALEREPGDAERLRSLLRVMHTLKGAANAAGVPLVAECCHDLETLLTRARSGATRLGRSEFDRLLSALDVLDDARRRLVAAESLAQSPLEEYVRATRTGAALPAARAMPAPPSAPPRPAPPAPAAPSREEQIRVPTAKLDTVLTLSRRLVVAEQRIQARAADAALLHEALAPLGAAGSDERLTELVRDTLRLTSAMMADARTLRLVTAELADQAGHLLMRRFRDATEPLARVVRDAAVATGKRAQLVVAGGEVEADRRVLDTLREVLPHLARNAVDHGIEPPSERERSGKAEIGTVRVAALVRGQELTVTVSDDGRGIDVDAVRSQLVQRGPAAPGDPEALLRAVFENGLSTRAEATTTSGRGVGLDVVRSSVMRLGGSVHVESIEGVGATFVLTCPVSLSVARALLFSAGRRLLAVPSSAIEHLIRLVPERIGRSQGRVVVTVPTSPAPVPLLPLRRLFGEADTDPGTETKAVVLLVGGRRLALAVNELLSEEELVVRPVPRLERRLPYLGGAALVGERVALVLNPPALIEAELALPTAGTLHVDGVAGRRKRILVVDDSITTRTLEQSVLEGAGYDVVTAVDGADAWHVLQEPGVDLVVADVQMPRMDGFALCEAIRASTTLRDLPVVLVTALETAEHRAHGLEVGADAYLGKSSFDQRTLLDAVHRLVEGR